MSRRFSHGTWVVAVAMALRGSVALGCPCGVTAGPAAPITSIMDTWALAAGVSVLHEMGTWDPAGVARGEPAGVRTDRVLLDVTAAWRPTPRVELQLQQGASVTLANAPGFTLRERALGDTVGHVRWEVLRPDEPHVPAGLALLGSVRAPTGGVSGSSSVASAVAGLGLGAWELGGGVELRRALGLDWEVTLAAEGAVRLPDPSTGVGRTLGPRFTTAASVAWHPTDNLAVALSVGEGWEGPTSVGGQTVPDSSLRRTSVSVGLTARVAGLRWTGSVSVDPLVEALGSNSVATLRAGLTVSRAR